MAAKDEEAVTSLVERFTENEEVLRIISDLKNPEIIGNDISLESGIERLTGLCVLAINLRLRLGV